MNLTQLSKLFNHVEVPGRSYVLPIRDVKSAIHPDRQRRGKARAKQVPDGSKDDRAPREELTVNQ